MTPKRACIVGAGIAGLAAAVRLQQIRWETMIVERAPQLRGGGYAVNFAGLGYEAAERMGLLPALAEQHLVYHEIVYLDGSGRRATMPLRAQNALLGPRSLNLMRGDIEYVLNDALDGRADARFGTTVTKVDDDGDGVTVTLDGGERERVDLLIGADGLHSAARHMVFGAEDRFRLDLGHVIAVYDLDRVPDEVPPNTSTSYNIPGRQVAVAHLGDGRTIAFFAYRTENAAKELAAGARVTLPQVYKDVGWIVPEILASLRRADSVYFDMVSQIRMGSWSRGRTVLLGDAAWCVTLFAGSGSALAVAGADLLGTHLARQSDVPAALRSWELELRPKVEKKQRAGRLAKDLFVPSDPLGLWLRHISLKAAASPLVTRMMELRRSGRR